MFVELMPLLVDRTVMLTLARLSDNSIRVVVIPERKGDHENAALATPFVITGTPQELDVELNIHLMGYVEQHHRLRTNLATTKSEMDAAVKTAREEAARKSAEQRKKVPPKLPETVTASAEPKDETRAVSTIDPPTNSSSEPTRNLFDD